MLSTSNVSLNAFINVNDAYTVTAYHTNNPSGAYINESINFKNLDNIINNLYIDIYYEDNIDTVKINLFLTYSNDNFFTKKVKSIS